MAISNFLFIEGIQKHLENFTGPYSYIPLRGERLSVRPATGVIRTKCAGGAHATRRPGRGIMVLPS